MKSSKSHTKSPRVLKSLESKTPWTRKLTVTVKRDGFSGHLYSSVLDEAAPPVGTGRRGTHIVEIVIDRQHGKRLDAETIKRRAQALSEILSLSYKEDLEWPCISVLGHDGCRCPKCVKQSK